MLRVIVHTFVLLIAVLAFTAGLWRRQGGAVSATAIGAIQPRISPDGESISVSYQGAIWTLPRDGGEMRRLTSGFGFDSYPAWSADGKRIGLLRRPGIPCDRRRDGSADRAAGQVAKLREDLLSSRRKESPRQLRRDATALVGGSRNRRAEAGRAIGRPRQRLWTFSGRRPHRLRHDAGRRRRADRPQRAAGRRLDHSLGRGRGEEARPVPVAHLRPLVGPRRSHRRQRSGRRAQRSLDDCPRRSRRTHAASRRDRPTRTALRLRPTAAGWSTRTIARAQPLSSAAISRRERSARSPVTRMDFRAPTGTLKIRVVEKGTGAPLTARVSVQQKNGKYFAPVGALYRMLGAVEHFYAAGEARPDGAVR